MERPPDQGRPTKRPKHTHQHEDYSAMLGPAEPSLGFSDLWSPTPQPATHPAMATSTILSADPSPAMFLVNDLDHPMPLYAPFEGDVHLSHMSLPPHRAPNADAMSSSHSSQSTHSTSPETRDMALSPIQSRMGLKSQKAKVSLPRVAQSDAGFADCRQPPTQSSTYRNIRPASDTQNLDLMNLHGSSHRVSFVDPFVGMIDAFAKEEPRGVQVGEKGIDGYIKVKKLSFTLPSSTRHRGIPYSGQEIMMSRSSVGRTYHTTQMIAIDRRLEQPRLDAPIPVPPQFGSAAPRMGRLDRALFEFYKNHWCPGRSIRHPSNLWKKDFAPLQTSKGAHAAMVMIGGVYVRDYCLGDKVHIRQITTRVEECYKQANLRLLELMNSEGVPTLSDSEESVALVCLLSMFDVITTSTSQTKGPPNPRWLTAFQWAETILERSDQGSRYWSSDNIQITNLRAANCVVVGRGIIITEIMMPLPHSAQFNQEDEERRFKWLLYGTKEDTDEIQSGCGFSRRLLHIIRQITWSAACLQQNSSSLIPPRFARFLCKDLHDMAQWVPELLETNPNDGYTVDFYNSGKPLKWDRNPESRLPHLVTAEDMILVTAECWRLAVLIYLHCRLERLPRNHPAVTEKMSQLAAHVRIMPTQGRLFTAQAPLFPVFLLGVLGLQEEHRETSRQWFEKVIQTPVRSSVPPLYASLQRIWSWIDKDTELSKSQDLPKTLGDRFPWWEKLVSLIQKREQKTLCLT